VTAGPSPLIRAGTLAGDGFALNLTPERAGWGFCGLRVVELAPGGTASWHTGADEMLVVPLAGGCVLDCDAEQTTRYGAAEDVPVELRGAGNASRQVNNLCTPDWFDADRIMVVEVLTPGGNWSSYPPHKHDEDRPDETALEEIYYFEVAAHAGRPGLGYHRVYGTAERPIDVCAQVGTGDVVVVPHGWHGPSMAAPGYHLYYLNVMAGQGERAWRFRDDPDHAWVRASWEGVVVDPRLPLTTATARAD
jgi:5-deoxy-glucuronate isomerase